MRLSVLVVVAAAGCYSKPDQVFGPVDARPGDGNGSADGPPSACASPIDDRFDDTGGTPCGTWGVKSIGGAMVRSGGTLAMNIGLNEDAHCRTATPVAFGTEVAAELSGVITGMDSDSTYLEATVGSETVRIEHVDAVSAANQLRLVGATPVEQADYNSTSMRWWRLVAMDSHTIQGGFSTDGQNWTPFGTATIAGSTDCMTIAIGGRTTAANQGFVDVETLRIVP